MKNSIFTTIGLLFALTSFAQTGPGGVGNSTTNRMWLKADANVYNDAGTTLATNGDLVEQWNDQSGNSINASQATSGNQPTYATGIVNGMPALQFSGNSFVDGSALGIAGTGGFTFIFALQATSYTAGTTFNGDGHYIMDRTTGTNELTSLKAASTNKYGFQKRADNGGGLGGPVSTSAINTSSFEIINYRRDRGTAYDLFVNGTLETTLADGDGDLTPPIPRIGRHATTANNGLNGYIAEMMAFSFDLNNAQINIVNSYLAAKYALTVANDKYTYDATHKTDVAGIGRENATEFHTDAQGSGIVRINNPSSLDIGDYLLWGHDDDTITRSNKVDVPTGEGIVQRMERDWRATHTGDVGTVDISFDLTGIGTVTTTDLRLLIDETNNGFADETVAGGTIISGATSLGGNVYQFTGITIGDSHRFTLGTINQSQTPLPIELISFETEAINNDYVQIDWITASEMNNDYFTIEKSQDGKIWEIQSEVDGARKSLVAKSYQTFDLNPYTGRSYYRLKQTDFNGNFSYSKTTVVSIKEENTIATVNIFPNPTKNQITISGDIEELRDITVLFTTALGKMLPALLTLFPTMEIL